MSEDLEQEESRRDTIARVISEASSGDDAPDKADEPVEEPIQKELELKTDEAPKASTEKPRDERGKYLSSKAPVVEVKPTLKPKEVIPNGQAKGEAQKPVPGLNAPQSWKPAIKEKVWAALPQEAKEEILRTEKETQLTKRENAGLKQQLGGWNQVVAPYEHYMRAKGADPHRTAQSLFQAAYTLEQGSRPQVAQMLAGLIQNHLPGEDGINMLASALNGQPFQQQGHQQHQQIDPQAIKQQLKQELAQEQQQYRMQLARQAAAEEEQAFAPNAEYMERLRDDMADILEVDARKKMRLPDGHPMKVNMTIEQAYEKAASMDPEISDVMNQRKEAERIAQLNADRQKSRNAGVSIRGQPTGAIDTLPAPGEDRRSDILRAMASVNRR